MNTAFDYNDHDIMEALEPSFRVCRLIIQVLLRLQRPRSEEIIKEILVHESMLHELIESYIKYALNRERIDGWQETYINQAIDPLLKDEAAAQQKAIALFNTARIHQLRNSALWDLEVLFNKQGEERENIASEVCDALALHGHRLPETVL